MRIGKITLNAKGITDEITDNHPIDICSVEQGGRLLYIIQSSYFYGNIFALNLFDFCNLGSYFSTLQRLLKNLV